MSSFYMKWRTNDEDAAMVRALTGTSSVRVASGGSGRATASSASQVTSRMARIGENSAIKSTTTTTIVRVQNSEDQVRQWDPNEE